MFKDDRKFMAHGGAPASQRLGIILQDGYACSDGDECARQGAPVCFQEVVARWTTELDDEDSILGGESVWVEGGMSVEADLRAQFECEVLRLGFESTSHGSSLGSRAFDGRTDDLLKVPDVRLAEILPGTQERRELRHEIGFAEASSALSTRSRSKNCSAGSLSHATIVAKPSVSGFSPFPSLEEVTG